MVRGGREAAWQTCWVLRHRKKGILLAAISLAPATFAHGQGATWAGTFLVGYGTTFLSTPTPGGPGFIVDLFRFSEGQTGFGLEIGYTDLGSDAVSRTTPFPGGALNDSIATSILTEGSRWYITPALQTRFKIGSATALLLGGIGYYRINARQKIMRTGVPDSINIPAFSDHSLNRNGLGANLGAGFVLASLGNHVDLNVQARGHFIIAKGTEDGSDTAISFDQFATLSIGVTVD